MYGYNGDGVDNIGFDDIPYSINEGYDNDVGSTRESFRTPQNANFPRADETIKLLRFEEPSSRYVLGVTLFECIGVSRLKHYTDRQILFRDRYFQIVEEREGIYADKIMNKLVRCFDKGLTEGFGILKIPFVIAILGIAHLVL